jgi:hypothetical protein
MDLNDRAFEEAKNSYTAENYADAKSIIEVECLSPTVRR